MLPELGGLLRRPLITLERVRVCKRDGEVLQTPRQLPGTEEHGMAMWHKLMIYCSEGALHDGQPMHRAITRQLRLRGQRIDHAAGNPVLPRRSPSTRRPRTATRSACPHPHVVIDTPERIADSFGIVDRLTNQRGMVTSGTVPALRATAGENGRGGVRFAKYRF